MKKLLILAMLAVVCMSCNAPVNGQATTDDAVAQRKAKILDNLKLQFPQLRDLDVVMGDFEGTSVEGLELGSFVIGGQRVQQFLVTADDTKLYFIGGDPIDVSKTSEEIAEAMAEEREAAAREARERSEELETIIAGLPVRGNPDAPVTIVEFSDFQCPYCARGFTTVEQILEKYPDDVKFVYLHFPLSNHPWARPAAIAAVCAAQQDTDAFWTLHDNYFRNQQQINPSNVLEQSEAFLAGSGIDMATWSACAGDAQSDAYKGAAAAVESAMQTGQKFGVTGTPGFFVNGHLLSGAQPLAAFESLIAQIKEENQQ